MRLFEGSSSSEKAKAEGFSVMGLSDAAEWADVIMMLVPDELQADVYQNHIEQRVKKGEIHHPYSSPYALIL